MSSSPPTPLRHLEAAKAAVAGVLHLAVYVVPGTLELRFATPLLALASALLLLAPPSARRAGLVKVAIATGFLSTVTLFVAGQMPTDGVAMSTGGITYGGGPLLIAFLLIALVLTAPLIGGLCALRHAWRIERPPRPATKTRRARAKPTKR